MKGICRVTHVIMFACTMVAGISAHGQVQLGPSLGFTYYNKHELAILTVGCDLSGRIGERVRLTFSPYLSKNTYRKFSDREHDVIEVRHEYGSTRGGSLDFEFMLGKSEPSRSFFLKPGIELSELLRRGSSETYDTSGQLLHESDYAVNANAFLLHFGAGKRWQVERGELRLALKLPLVAVIGGALPRKFDAVWTFGLSLCYQWCLSGDDCQTRRKRPDRTLVPEQR